MSETPHSHRRSRIFYGWWIVTGGAIAMAVSAGLNFYGFSVFFQALTKDFGWRRGVLSGVISLSRLEGGFLGPVEGILVDKFGPRKIMLVGIPLFGIGFILLSRVNSLLSLALVYILGVTLGSALGTFTPVGAAVANWFVRRRSLAVGIMMSGVGLGGAVFVPLVGWWISTYDWRSAAVAAGVLSLAVLLPIALIMRHRPEQYGYLPDGENSPNDPGPGVIGARAVEGRWQPAEASEFSPLQSLKTLAFWFLGLSLGMRSIVTTGFTLHFVAIMVDRDLSLALASSLLGAVALLSIVGRLGFAWLGDLVDKRYLFVASMSAMALAMLGMSLVQSRGPVMAMLALYSVAYGGSIVLPVALQADYFGRHAFATIRGLLNSVQTGGTLVGPVLAGFIYDATESYTMAFLGFAAAAALAALLLLGLRRPVMPPAATAH